MVTDLEAVVTGIDKRIDKMRAAIVRNPTQLREGMKMAYEDVREMVQIMRQIKRELP